jgi:uncharacterized protein (DUF302 family)
MIFKTKHKMYIAKINFILLILSLSIINNTVLADDLFMIRSTQPFPETMASLQQAIKNTGNTLSRVQRIDVGLTKMGYKTDKYRVVFYGKLKEINMLVEKHPELIPYLPLKIAIFSEDGQTLLTATNPERLSEMYPDKSLKPLFLAWTKNLRAIMDEVQNASENEGAMN